MHIWAKWRPILFFVFFLNIFNFLLDYSVKVYPIKHCALSICTTYKEIYSIKLFKGRYRFLIGRPAVPGDREFDWEAWRSSPAVSYVTSVINDNIDTSYADRSYREPSHRPSAVFIQYSSFDLRSSNLDRRPTIYYWWMMRILLMMRNIVT